MKTPSVFQVTFEDAIKAASFFADRSGRAAYVYDAGILSDGHFFGVTAQEPDEILAIIRARVEVLKPRGHFVERLP